VSRAGVARRLVAGLSILTVLGACSGGDGADDASPGTDDTAADEAVEVSAPAPPPRSPAGTGVVVVGGTSSIFEVTSCRLEPDPSEPEGARTLVALAGSGETARGDAFSVEVQRFATGTDVQTFTDTAVYTDTARILQAQRIEVGGQVTDLRDPDATSALIRVRGDGLSLSGLASGPGEDAEDGGLIGLALDATC
jgi:hypothetical protein